MSDPKAKSAPKPKYDPKAKYVALKRIHHPAAGFIDPGQVDDNDKPFSFDMSHRSADEVEYLVDERKVIKSA